MTAKQLKIVMMSSTQQKVLNKSPSVPQTPAPVAAPPPPTVDNSEEVKKQRAIEAERAKREKGLSATDNTGGEGVPLQEENVQKKTLLGE
jgi:hypothetical protein